LNKFDGLAHGFALFLGKNFDGQIRTPEFAEFAADAVLGPNRYRLLPVIQLQNLFGAEFHADPASLAPVPVDDVLFQFGFSHSSFLFMVQILLGRKIGSGKIRISNIEIPNKFKILMTDLND
jgi:hypothetical protein